MHFVFILSTSSLTNPHFHTENRRLYLIYLIALYRAIISAISVARV